MDDPILMALFAAGGTIYGMAEESLAFYALIIPVMIAAGYDALTAVAIIMLGAGVGTLGRQSIPSPPSSRPTPPACRSRTACRCVSHPRSRLAHLRRYVMRYAERVRGDPSKSLVADLKSNREHFLKSQMIGHSCPHRRAQDHPRSSSGASPS